MVKILHISDWHVIGMEEVIRRFEPLMERYGMPDQIVMSGDMLFNTNAWRCAMFELEAERQRNFWEQQFVPYIQGVCPKADLIAVPGNHDYCDYGIEGVVHSIDDGAATFKIGGITYTGYRGVCQYEGQWDREYRDDVHQNLCNQLDKNADILLTHTPAFACLGGPHPIHFGAKPLREWTDKVDCNIKAHLFGHAHEAGGIARLDDRNVVHSNAADSHNCILIGHDAGAARIFHPVYGFDMPQEASNEV